MLKLGRVVEAYGNAVCIKEPFDGRGRRVEAAAFLDISLDFVFCAIVPLAFALADPGDSALAAAVLIASFVGTFISLLAFSMLAERKALRSTKFSAKGICYVGALAEGAQTIAVFVAMFLFPGSLQRSP